MSTIEYTITDQDLLESVRRQGESLGRLAILAEAWSSYQQFNGKKADEVEFGTAEQIRALHVARIQVIRTEAILASVVEGKALPAGADTTSPEVAQTLHPDERPQQGPDPSGLFGRFLQ